MIEPNGGEAGHPILPVGMPRARRWADLLPRVGSGLVLITLALATAIVGGHAFALLWLAASAAVLWEWQHLIGGDRLLLRFGIGGVTLAVCLPLVAASRLGPALLVIVLGMAAAATAASAGLRWAAGLGVVYASALVVSVVILRSSFPEGLAAMFWLFAIVWGTDIMAYFGGRLLGGPKLWPRLSPSKTWSGFAVGIVSGALAGLLVKPMDVPAIPCLVMGLIVGAVSQGGDLFESSLKRRYGVKDASHLIPGHGGVMDRLDGFIAAAVFAAALGVARFGPDGAGAGLFSW